MDDVLKDLLLDLVVAGGIGTVVWALLNMPFMQVVKDAFAKLLAPFGVIAKESVRYLAAVLAGAIGTPLYWVTSCYFAFLACPDPTFLAWLNIFIQMATFGFLGSQVVHGVTDLRKALKRKAVRSGW